MLMSLRSALAGLSLRRAMPAPLAVRTSGPTASAPRQSTAAELGSTGQAAKVEAVGTEVMFRSQSIRAIQATAARQLDAAAYALSRMTAELECVMAVPLPIPAHSASVHPLEPLVRRGREDFWRKVAAA